MPGTFKLGNQDHSQSDMFTMMVAFVDESVVPATPLPSCDLHDGNKDALALPQEFVRKDQSSTSALSTSQLGTCIFVYCYNAKGEAVAVHVTDVVRNVSAGKKHGLDWKKLFSGFSDTSDITVVLVGGDIDKQNGDQDKTSEGNVRDVLSSLHDYAISSGGCNITVASHRTSINPYCDRNTFPNMKDTQRNAFIDDYIDSLLMGYKHRYATAPHEPASQMDPRQLLADMDHKWKTETSPSEHGIADLLSVTMFHNFGGRDQNWQRRIDEFDKLCRTVPEVIDALEAYVKTDSGRQAVVGAMKKRGEFGHVGYLGFDANHNMVLLSRKVEHGLPCQVERELRGFDLPNYISANTAYSDAANPQLSSKMTDTLQTLSQQTPAERDKGAILTELRLPDFLAVKQVDAAWQHFCDNAVQYANSKKPVGKVAKKEAAAAATATSSQLKHEHSDTPLLPAGGAAGAKKDSTGRS